MTTKTAVVGLSLAVVGGLAYKYFSRDRNPAANSGNFCFAGFVCFVAVRITFDAYSADDPHLWLEDVLGEAPLKWAQERNAECNTHLGLRTSTFLLHPFCLTLSTFLLFFFHVWWGRPQVTLPPCPRTRRFCLSLIPRTKSHMSPESATTAGIIIFGRCARFSLWLCFFVLAAIYWFIHLVSLFVCYLFIYLFTYLSWAFAGW